jgi:hypothetical protein
MFTTDIKVKSPMKMGWDVKAEFGEETKVLISHTPWRSKILHLRLIRPCRVSLNPNFLLITTYFLYPV